MTIIFQKLKILHLLYINIFVSYAILYMFQYDSRQYLSHCITNRRNRR